MSWFNSTVLAFVASMVSLEALAAARCDEPISDGNDWKLVCAADDAHESEDDYQCDYVISITESNGMTDQQEATGAISPGQNGVVIWSSTVYGDDVHIVSARIVSGSCTR